MQDELAPLQAHIDRRFDEIKDFVSAKMEVPKVRLDAIDGILANRDTDHEKIGKRLEEKLEPKIDLLLKTLNDHVVDENVWKKTIEQRVEALEHKDVKKEQKFKDQVKGAAINWGVPVIILLIFEWAQQGFHIPGLH